MVIRLVQQGSSVICGMVLGLAVAAVSVVHASPVVSIPCSLSSMPVSTLSGRTVTDSISHVRLMASHLHFIKNGDPSNPTHMVAVIHVVLRNRGRKLVQTYASDLLLHGMNDAADYDQMILSIDITLTPLQPSLLAPGQTQAGDLSIIVPVAG